MCICYQKINFSGREGDTSITFVALSTVGRRAKSLSLTAHSTEAKVLSEGVGAGYSATFSVGKHPKKFLKMAQNNPKGSKIGN